jgi:hypothetical protein
VTAETIPVVDDDPEPQPTRGVPEPETGRVRVVSLAEFAASDEVIPEPLVGDGEKRLLPAGATLVLYGEGGSGKTTLAIDLACHLAAGVEWLGFPIGRPCRVLLLENEGPRAEFRLKLRRKLAAWDGPGHDDRLQVLEDPWGQMDLRRDQDADELAAALERHEIDVLLAGPIRRLGLDGGGTPAETVAFMALLDRIRRDAHRPIAVGLVHHENKGGDISGAFEAEFDTVIHVKPGEGRDRTQLYFRKSRWSSKIHRSRATLAWTDGEGFDLVESDLDADRTAAARDAAELDALHWIVQYVENHFADTGSGIASGKVETAYHEAHDNHGRNLARRLIKREVQLAGCWFENAWTGETPPRLATTIGETKHGTYLIPFSHALSPLATTPNGDNGDNPHLPLDGDTSRHLAAALREGGGWREGGEGPRPEELEWH